MELVGFGGAAGGGAWVAGAPTPMPSVTVLCFLGGTRGSGMLGEDSDAEKRESGLLGEEGGEETRGLAVDFDNSRPTVFFSKLV